MSKDPWIYIRHIADAISRIEHYMNKVEKADFMSNDLLQAGVIRELEIIGEASKKTPKDFKDERAEIPWRKMAGMRDKLIHDYFGVDIEAVWKTIQVDLPVLKTQIHDALSKENPVINK